MSDSFFSPKLPLTMRVRNRKTTIDMNLGGARFAGETMRRSVQLPFFYTRYAVQVRLIGAKLIVQVRR